MSPSLLFVLFTAAAFTLMVLEIFVPGGILGILGAISLVAASVYAFQAFGPSLGMLVSALLLVGTLAAFMGWLVLLPKTRMGRRMALATDLRDSKSAPDDESLVGQRGVAETELRPSGYARIGGKRLDVVSSRGFIEIGTPVEVLEVHGMRVVVAAVREATGDAA